MLARPANPERNSQRSCITVFNHTVPCAVKRAGIAANIGWLDDLDCTSDRALIRLSVKRMRRKIANETWEQIKTAYVAGINLREIARKMNIPEGTVLAHAKRHGWSQPPEALPHGSAGPATQTGPINLHLRRTKLPVHV